MVASFSEKSFGDAGAAVSAFLPGSGGAPQEAAASADKDRPASVPLRRKFLRFMQCIDLETIYCIRGKKNRDLPRFVTVFQYVTPSGFREWYSFFYTNFSLSGL